MVNDLWSIVRWTADDGVDHDDVEWDQREKTKPMAGQRQEI
jgi:hypothetical protein